MPFLLKAHDLPNALERRMAVRESHLSALAVYKDQGKVLYAAAMLDDAGNLCGSLMMLDMTREEIDALLTVEPYIQANVWDTSRIEIIPVRVAPGFDKK